MLLSADADQFLTNRAYGSTAYSFGEMFVHQLGAVVGEKVLAKGLIRYYNTCKFKHPEPIDFERVMEKEKLLHLKTITTSRIYIKKTERSDTKKLSAGGSIFNFGLLGLKL